jgi:hypothetical protein
MNQTPDIEQQSPPLLPEETWREQLRKSWQYLQGGISMKGNLRFLAYVTFLLLLLIANSHYAIELQRALNTEDKKLKELRWRYMDVKTKLMNAGTEADIIRRGAAIGLKPLVMPAYTLGKDTGIIRNSSESKTN